MLESVVARCAFDCWPPFAEQKLNAAMLIDEDVKVALRPKANENGLVEREKIAKVIKGLLNADQGVRIRERMNKLKDAAGNAVSKRESFTKSLSEMALKFVFSFSPEKTN